MKDPSPFYILPFHHDRLLQAAEHFGWTKAKPAINGPTGFAHLLSKLEEAIDVKSPTPLRVKTILDHDGKITFETQPVPPVPKFNLLPHRLPPPRSAAKVEVSPLTGGALTLGDGDAVYGDPEVVVVWDVVPDTIRTDPSPYTTYKTTSRDMYDGARARAGIKSFADKKEVLILSSKEGEIMEGSTTSVYFWRNGKWTTPAVASGGHVGTTRRWALGKGYCVEGVVRVDELVDGEECWISNGVRGFTSGKVKLS